MSKLSNFAAIKAFYEDQNDLISSFAYFALQVIEEKPKLIGDIQKDLIKVFDLKIPSAIIEVFLRKLKRKNLIDYKDINSGIELRDAGKEQLKEVEQEVRDSRRQVSSLILAIKDFIKKTTRQVILEESIESELNLFLKSNLSCATLMLHGDKSYCVEPYSPENPAVAESIMDFFVHAEKNDSTNYQILRNLVNGTIITTALDRRNIAEIDRGFDSNMEVYLDSNIVFSLLGLHEEMINQSAQELVELIKKFDFRLKIFGFTKEQVVSILRGYIEDNSQYTKNIPVNSIYSRLSNKYTKQEVALLIMKIEEELNTFDISVNNSITLDDFSYDNGETTRLEQFKQNDFTSVMSLKHDIAACKAICKIRGGDILIFEKSKAIFLTGDKKLANFNFIEYKHSSSNPPTIPEVSSIEFLTSILWLKIKDFSCDLPIHNIIAGLRQNFLVRGPLYNYFLEELSKLKQSRKFDQNDINLLMSSNEISAFLLEVQQGDKKKEEIKIFVQEEVERLKEERLKDKDQIRSQQELLRAGIEKMEEPFNELAKTAEENSSEILILEEYDKVKKENDSLKTQLQEDRTNRQKSWTVVKITVCLLLFIAVVFVVVHYPMAINKYGKLSLAALNNNWPLVLLMILILICIFTIFFGWKKIKKNFIVKSFLRHIKIDPNDLN